jgi:6-phosphofructokinase 1
MTSSTSIKKIALLCSGGDSPGMNCAIRSIVRTSIGEGLEVVGIKRGYQGLLDEKFMPMDVSSVGNIIQHGGTILQTSRCPKFHEPETRKRAYELLKKNNVDALIVIGGNGSYNGAFNLNQETNMPVVCLPGTIDNDITGTEYTIGFDTAVQTAVEAVDNIRDTAHSHERTFIVEVMGRKSSAIAMHVGVCTGAENIVFPLKEELDDKQIADDIQRGIKRGKTSSIIICAEGEKPGLSYRLQQLLELKHGIAAHVCILGHIQRGGRPSAIDRFIASSMGYHAIHSLVKGSTAVATCFVDGKVVIKPLSECLEKKTDYLPHYLDLVHSLSI